MIYTVTLNPAVDCTMTVDNYREGTVNRADPQTITAGGKGINVAVILNRLGISAKALGFCAGETGELLCRLLDRTGCPNAMTFLDSQLTRVNTKLRCGDCETEINGKGPDIPPQALENFIGMLENTVTEDDTLVLAGSVPASVPDSVYADIMGRLSGRGVRIAADASGKLLTELLPFHPFLIKPNNIELGEILGREITTRSEALDGAAELQKMGAENVIVSLAGEGAVLLTSDGERYETAAPEGTVKSSVGAGDSMLAGFLAGLEIYADHKTALMLGTASGSATAFSDKLAEKEEITRIFNRLCKINR